jgi:hypothetical protein
LKKDWVNGAAGDSTTLTATGSGVIPGGTGSVIAAVPSGGNGTSANTVTIPVASGETVHLSETKTPANTGTYSNTLACNAGTLSAATGALTVPAPPHGDITCTFTNTRESAPVPPPAAPPPVTPEPPSGPLAVTGLMSNLYFLAALTMLAAGGALVTVSRRGRARRRHPMHRARKT